MRNIIKFLLFIPLLYSCQKYNQAPYDKKEEILRGFPIENSNRMVFDSLWAKRDSLTYLRLKNLDLILMSETLTIPNWIGNFEKMRIFQVDNERKKIKSIPSNFGKLSNLIEISIPNNNVTMLPDSFYNLKNLTYVDLKNNPIVSINDKISNLSNLQILLLDNTDIKALPKSICRLSQLESLGLQNTKISKLPKCLEYLSKLDRIDVSGTQLTEFPIEILNAPKLETIDAKGLHLKNYKEVKSICEKKNINFYYDVE